MEWLLTINEILEIRRQNDRIARSLANDSEGNFRQDDMEAILEEGYMIIAKVQAKKLVQWGDSECKEHGHSLCHFDCPECMNKLYEELGLGWR